MSNGDFPHLVSNMSFLHRQRSGLMSRQADDGVPRRSVGRLWIGPDATITDLDLVMISHSMAVASDPRSFGLEDDMFSRHMALVDDGECDFDFERAILLAEMQGWVRTSRDTSFTPMAVSATNPSHAAKAIQCIIGKGYDISQLTLEIERITSGTIETNYHVLDNRDLRMFLKYGRLPSGNSYIRTIEHSDLADWTGESGHAPAAMLP